MKEMRKKGPQLKLLGQFMLGTALFVFFLVYAWKYGDWVGNPRNSPFQNARLLPGFLGVMELLWSLAAFFRLDWLFGAEIREKKLVNGKRNKYAIDLLWKGLGLIVLQILMDKWIPFTKFM